MSLEVQRDRGIFLTEISETHIYNTSVKKSTDLVLIRYSNI